MRGIAGQAQRKLKSHSRDTVISFRISSGLACLVRTQGWRAFGALGVGELRVVVGSAASGNDVKLTNTAASFPS